MIDSRGTDPAPDLRTVGGGGAELGLALELDGVDSGLEPGFCAVPSMTAVIFLCCCDIKDPNNGEVNGVDISEAGFDFDFVDFLPPSV
jgi:hypothetical protein